MKLILKYFPSLTATQIDQFSSLFSIYKEWNSKINVISRRDIDELYLRHVLHSLAIAKIIQFKSGSSILDVGTGGGFPGIPLAILYPSSNFHLVDSINKKLIVIEAVVNDLRLKNVKTTHARAEALTGKYDFIVSRAVTSMPVFVNWIKDKISTSDFNQLKNGILYLKGGDLDKELKDYPNAKIYELSAFFEEEFFDTKKLVHLVP